MRMLQRPTERHFDGQREFAPGKKRGTLVQPRLAPHGDNQPFAALFFLPVLTCADAFPPTSVKNATTATPNVKRNAKRMTGFFATEKRKKERKTCAGLFSNEEREQK
jgi:hypothetical protein